MYDGFSSNALSKKEQLLFCAANADSFQELVDCASSLLGASVIVTDPFHYIIAASADAYAQTVENPTWSDLIDSGLVPPILPKTKDHMFCLERAGDGAERMGASFVIQDPAVTRTDAVCTMGGIFQGESLELRFAVTSPQPLSEGQRSLMVTLALTFQLACHKWSMSAHADARGLYLMDMLHGRATTDVEVLRKVQFDAKGVYRMYCFDSSDLTPHNLSFIPISATIRHAPDVLSAMDGANFVLLVNCREEHAKLRQQLTQFSKEAHIPILESYELMDLSLASDIYGIMQVATSIARGFQGASGILPLSDFSMFLFFERIAQYNQREVIIHPDAELLMRHDAKKGSDLAQTAYCYLLHNREAPATAQALFIHRNTLDKRLRKMEALIDAKWHSVSYQLVMLTSLYLLLKRQGKLIYYKVA